MGNRHCATLPFADPSHDSDTWDFEVLIGHDFWTYAPHTQFVLKGFAASGLKGFQTLKMAEMIEPTTGEVWKSTVQVDVDAMIQYPMRTMRRVPSSLSKMQTKAEFMLSEFPTLESMMQRLKAPTRVKCHPPWVDIAFWVTLDKPTNWEMEFPMWVKKNNVHNYRTFEDILLAREEVWKTNKDLFFKEIYVSPFDEKTRETALEIDRAITIWQQLLPEWEHIDSWCEVAKRNWVYVSNVDWLHPWHLYRNHKLNPLAPPFVIEFARMVEQNRPPIVEPTIGPEIKHFTFGPRSKYSQHYVPPITSTAA